MGIARRIRSNNNFSNLEYKDCRGKDGQELRAGLHIVRH